ncbi:MAG: cation-transporting P-type ATPase [Phycisphaerae bacterium]|jgi:Ca2+-transporting ATPase
MSKQRQPFHARDVDDVLGSFGVQPEQGLTAVEAKSRRREHGPNRLHEAKRRSIATILLDQFKSIVVLILAVAGLLAFSFGRWAEGIAIVAVIVINGCLGFVSEWRAVRSLEALRRIGKRRARSRREGRERHLPVSALVPGDIVILEGGDSVPADIRLIEANGLLADESTLTGESTTVHKHADAVDAGRSLAERSSMLFKGTTITNGSGQGVVVATGMRTELGNIAELAGQAQNETTPLEKRLDQLGWRLAWAILAVTALIAAVGLAAGRPMLPMIETAIALGVAAIPEGLPIVATLALARGMWLMSKRHALVNRLAAVETLGATRVILTDKTGTLTENRMTVRRVVTAAGDHDLNGQGDRRDLQSGTPAPKPGDAGTLLRRVLEVGVLCNNASLDPTERDGRGEAHGDPTEIALLQAGDSLGVHKEELLAAQPEVKEIAFSTDSMMMATVHRADARFRVAVKGAPQAVLEASDHLASDTDESDRMNAEDRRAWLDRSEALAGDGLRVLAMAEKTAGLEDEEPYHGLRFLGLVALWDPPRKGVRESITACQRSGVRVVMVTGDQPKTAAAIARQVGLVDDDRTPTIVHGRELRAPDELSSDDRARVLDAQIFARVSPEQKLRLVQLFQENGDTVAMTGDGVNDAPALKKADIGIAMGKRGTDAAREVAEMVLEDDALSSIEAAIRQGRVIFGNIRKSVIFMLCTNVAEVIAVALATLCGAPLPLRPLQILYLNVLTDAWPALALSVNKEQTGVMDQPPRDPKEAVLTNAHWWAIAGWGLTIAVCVLASLGLALSWQHMDRPRAVTVSFLTLGFAKLGFVFNLRSRHSSPWRNEILSNPWVWFSFTLCVVLLVAAIHAPGLAPLLETRPPGGAGWALIASFGAIPLVGGQALQMVQNRGRRVRGR